MLRRHNHMLPRHTAVTRASCCRAGALCHGAHSACVLAVACDCPAVLTVARSVGSPDVTRANGPRHVAQAPMPSKSNPCPCSTPTATAHAHAVRVQALLCRRPAARPPLSEATGAVLGTLYSSRRSWRRSPPAATARLRPGERLTSANGACPWGRWLEVRVSVRVRDRVRVS